MEDGRWSTVSDIQDDAQLTREHPGEAPDHDASHAEISSREDRLQAVSTESPLPDIGQPNCRWPRLLVTWAGLVMAVFLSRHITQIRRRLRKFYEGEEGTEGSLGRVTAANLAGDHSLPRAAKLGSPCLPILTQILGVVTDLMAVWSPSKPRDHRGTGLEALLG